MHNGNFNKTKYVFPNWRSVNKSKWVVPNMPFVTTTTSQYKRQEKPVSHDPYIEKVAVQHMNTKKVVSKLRLPTSLMNSRSVNDLKNVSLQEFQRINTPQAPAFSSYSRNDAIWSERVDDANSL